MSSEAVIPVFEDVVEGIGEVTMLQEVLPKGLIDGKYFFERELASESQITKGSMVEFKARLSGEVPPQWEVISMKLYVSPEDNVKAYRRKFLGMIGKVISINDEFATVKFGKSVQEDVQIVPVGCLPQDYRVWRGDYVDLKLELNDPDGIDEGGKIHSVEPTNRKKIIGQVTCVNGRFCIDNYIYFDQSVCASGRYPKARDTVCVDAVESQQGPYPWRAISVRPSKFRDYTAVDGAAAWSSNSCSDSLIELMKDKHRIKIGPKVVYFPDTQIGSFSTCAVEISNTAFNAVTLEEVVVKGDQAVCRFEVGLDSEGGILQNIKNTTIGPQMMKNIKIRCHPQMLGSTREMIVFNFGDFEIGRQVAVTALPSDLNLMKELTINEGEHQQWQNSTVDDGYARMVEDAHRPSVRGVPAIRAPFFMQKRMDPNPVPKYMWSILENADDKELYRKHPGALEDLRIQNYLDKFRAALWLEEMENHVIRSQYNLENVFMRPSGELLVVEVPGLKDIHPPILLGDPISAIDLTDAKETKYEGYVGDMRGEDVYIKFDEQFAKDYRKTPVTIQFSLGRTTYKRCHFAIEQAVRYLGEDWLFPEPNVTCKLSRIPFIELNEQDAQKPSENNETSGQSSVTNGKSKSLPKEMTAEQRNGKDSATLAGSGRFLNKRLASLQSPFESDTQGPSGEALKLVWYNKTLNEEQKDAVRRILRGQSRPLPYIVYGPPGTGKTVTIVEAIIQVNKLDKNSRVLVVTPSNSAADVIASGLVSSDQFVTGDFVRLVGFLRSESQIPENIRDFCRDGEYLDAVARHRLIVCTCTTAGQFFQLGLNTGHFTHVFIDEAGYCTEPEALIGASLVALDKSGQVILAGDPKQLGPVLMSDAAAKCGLAISLLERLMNLSLYLRNEVLFPKEKYNPLLLTKLVKNYRAHPTLLKLPSKLFYDDELEAAASKESINLSERLDFFKDGGTPLLFHGIQGTCTRDINSPSWYNTAEVIQVVDYVRLFRKNGVPSENIGIITPYRKQVEKLRSTLELGLLTDDIPKVGSVEEFQGGEREVMIMSLVRSATERELEKVVDRMSFVFSPKRFNVAVTRAKAVLIVLGNPHVLVHDPIWFTFIKYCVDLGCYTGCNLPPMIHKEGAHPYASIDEDWS